MAATRSDEQDHQKPKADHKGNDFPFSVPALPIENGSKKGPTLTSFWLFNLPSFSTLCSFLYIADLINFKKEGDSKRKSSLGWESFFPQQTTHHQNQSKFGGGGLDDFVVGAAPASCLPTIPSQISKNKEEVINKFKVMITELAKLYRNNNAEPSWVVVPPDTFMCDFQDIDEFDIFFAYLRGKLIEGGISEEELKIENASLNSEYSKITITDNCDLQRLDNFLGQLPGALLIKEMIPQIMSDQIQKRINDHAKAENFIDALRDIDKLPVGIIKDDIPKGIESIGEVIQVGVFLQKQYEKYRKRLFAIVNYEYEKLNKKNLENLRNDLLRYRNHAKLMTAEIVNDWHLSFKEAMTPQPEVQRNRAGYQVLKEVKNVKDYELGELPELDDYKRYKQIGKARKCLTKKYGNAINQRLLGKENQPGTKVVTEILQCHNDALTDCLAELRKRREKLINFITAELADPRLNGGYEIEAKDQPTNQVAVTNLSPSDPITGQVTVADLSFNDTKIDSKKIELSKRDGLLWFKYSDRGGNERSIEFERFQDGSPRVNILDDITSLDMAKKNQCRAFVYEKILLILKQNNLINDADYAKRKSFEDLLVNLKSHRTIMSAQENKGDGLTNMSSLDEIIKFHDQIKKFEQEAKKIASFRRGWDVFFPFFETTSRKNLRTAMKSPPNQQQEDAQNNTQSSSWCCCFGFGGGK